MKRRIISLLLTSVILMTLGSCDFQNVNSSSDETSTMQNLDFDTSEEVIPESEPEIVESEVTSVDPLLEKLEGIRNPLSGEECTEEIANLRPFAITVVNTKKALPQWGISGAEVIMEWMVTISMTRLCALYQGFDEDQVDIGAVRSVRVNLAHTLSGLDVIAMSASGPDNALQAVSDLNMDYINLLSKGYSACYRDETLRSSKGLEYSLIVDPEKMEARAQKLIDRRNHNEGYESFLNFTANAVPEEGQKAESVLIDFQKCKKTSFTYDNKNDVYQMFEYNQEVIDAKTNVHVSFTNLIVLMVETWDLGDNSSHVGVSIPGSGAGYFCNGGKMVPITWSKPSDTANFSFKLEDGSPLQVGVGHSYIAFAPLNSEVTFE